MGARAPKHQPYSRLAPRHQPPERDRQAGRQYATNSRAWRGIRAQVLAEEPLCRQCQQAGRTTPATVVDHVDGNARNNRRDNLQPLCAPCHSAKTAREDGGFGNRKQG